MLCAVNDCGIVQHQLLQPLHIFTSGGAHQHALARPRNLHIHEQRLYTSNDKNQYSLNAVEGDTAMLMSFRIM